MKTKSILVSAFLVPLLLAMTTAAYAHVVEPLALGALGTALGFAIGGSATDAAIGGAAGIGAGLLLNAPHYSAVHYRGYASPTYRHGCGWVRGHYSYYGAWVPGHYRCPGWGPGHYNRYDDRVPGHWR